MKKKIFIFVFVLFLSLSLFAGGKKESGTIKIGISKLMTHPALDLIEEAIVKTLNESGLNVEIEVQNANGDIATAAQIAQLFKTGNKDLVIGIATPTAQALANVFTDIPVIYATVTDVEAAGLANLDNVCGTSDAVPYEEHFKLIKRLLGIRTLGMVYTSSEANGVASMEEMRKICQLNGVAFVPSAVTNTSEVRTATLAIADRVDAIYVSNDNTVISAITTLSDVALSRGVPVISADTTSSFDTDVMIAGGFNYYDSGLLTGEIAVRVLKGENPKDIGIVYLTGQDYYINLDIASELNIVIPDDVLANAEYIVKDGITTAV